MDEKLYRIGEAARILNLSVPTLRYYDKLHLITPAYIDPETGYRYYSRDQFHYIDRIKYLQNLGLSLADITKIMTSDKSESLLPYLENKKRDCDRQIEEAERKKELLEWYIQYFSYGADTSDDSTYERILPERHIVSVPYEDEQIPTTTDLKLLEAKNLPGLKDLSYQRQWGCILNFDKLLNKEYCITHSFNPLASAPAFSSKYFRVIPDGVYLCFKTKLFANDFENLPAVKAYFNNPHITHGVVVAIEFENNFHEYLSSLYEVQIEIIHK